MANDAYRVVSDKPSRFGGQSVAYMYPEGSREDGLSGMIEEYDQAGVLREVFRKYEPGRGEEGRIDSVLDLRPDGTREKGVTTYSKESAAQDGFLETRSYYSDDGQLILHRDCKLEPSYAGCGGAKARHDTYWDGTDRLFETIWDYDVGACQDGLVRKTARYWRDGQTWAQALFEYAAAEVAKDGIASVRTFFDADGEKPAKKVFSYSPEAAARLGRAEETRHYRADGETIARQEWDIPPEMEGGEESRHLAFDFEEDGCYSKTFDSTPAYAGSSGILRDAEYFDDQDRLVSIEHLVRPGSVESYPGADRIVWYYDPERRTEEGNVVVRIDYRKGHLHLGSEFPESE